MLSKILYLKHSNYGIYVTSPSFDDPENIAGKDKLSDNSEGKGERINVHIQNFYYF